MIPETQKSPRLPVRNWARNLHVYLSMFGLQAILFFSMTGFMLNHSDWFGSSEPITRKLEGSFSPEMIRTPNELAIVESLRKHWGATGALNSFETHDDELRVVFKSPARRFEAVIHRPDGHLTMTLESYGFAGRIMELHRGEDAGTAWGWVIDATAIVLVLTSLTGLILWVTVVKWRKLGLISLGTTTAICGLIYYFLVP